MADYGVKLYGDAILVAPNFAQEKPDAVRAFLRAYVKALKDTMRDPALAVDAVLRRNDSTSKDVELERLRLAIRDNILTPAVKASSYGAIDPERFAAAIDQIALTYHFKAKDKAADVFDLSFLRPPVERVMATCIREDRSLVISTMSRSPAGAWRPICSRGTRRGGGMANRELEPAAIVLGGKQEIHHSRHCARGPTRAGPAGRGP